MLVRGNYHPRILPPGMADRKGAGAAGRPTKPAVVVMFVFKVPAANHRSFDDWAARYDRYKEGLGIDSEHFITLPLPQGAFDGWRGLETAVGTPVEGETWVVIERYKSRELRTEFLNSRDEPERVKFFAELQRITAPGDQIMNEHYPKGWKGYR